MSFECSSAVAQLKFSRIDGAATMKSCRARSVLVRGTTICKVTDDCSARASARVCTRSPRHVGVAVAAPCGLSVLSCMRASLEASGVT